MTVIMFRLVDLYLDYLYQWLSYIITILILS